jgi:methylase of polypeptide subunit release factors
MLQPQNITDFYINKYVNKGDTVIDATMGNGFDTLKLAGAVGENGKVYAFDIQSIAIENTKKLLSQNNISNVKLILDSHSNIDKYINESVKCVVFNLGYLPGGDHKKQTKYETTICAIEKSLAVLSDKGFVSVTVYYGKNSGTEEKEAVMEYFKNLDYKKYTVLVLDFYNRPNNPPLNVIITKN